MRKLCVYFIVPYLIVLAKGSFEQIMKRNWFSNQMSNADWKLTKHFLGNERNKCPSGWSFNTIANTRKCLFTSTSKVEISKLAIFCQSLNATVPYPQTNEENQNYREAFKAKNVTTSVAIRSRHGIVELQRNGYWNPFPTETALNAVCERTIFFRKSRNKRQASPGNRFLDSDHCALIFWSCVAGVSCDIRLEIIFLKVSFLANSTTLHKIRSLNWPSVRRGASKVDLLSPIPP